MFSRPAIATLTLAALFLTSSLPASAGLFGASNNDVAVKVAELPTQDSHAIVQGLDFSPDGIRLAEDSDGKFINIWDWRNKRIDKSITAPKGFNAVQVQNGLLYSPDGRSLAACAGRGVGDVFVHQWNTEDWSVAPEITDPGVGGCDGISFPPSGQFLIRIVNRVGNPGDTIIVHSAGTGQPIFGLSIDRFFTPVSVASNPDGESVAVAGYLSVAKQKEIVNEIEVYIISLQQRKVVRVISTEALGPLAWSPDGKRIAVAGGNAGIEIFDALTGKNLVSEKIESAGRMNIRFTPDGRYFIDSDLNGMGKGLGVKIWDSQRHTLLQQIPGDIGSIAVSRDRAGPCRCLRAM
jgi:WD40 repeat protein